MTSDVSCVLALAKDGSESVVDSWREDLEKDEHSFRSQYASDQIINAVHGSDSHDSAARELAFFFNNSSSKATKQRTLALIRPTAFASHKDQIMKRIKDSGFEIAMAKSVQFDENQAADFYAEHKDKPFYPDLIKEMTQ
jgi:nucleoside diphosphate kinase